MDGRHRASSRTLCWPPRVPIRAWAGRQVPGARSCAHTTEQADLRMKFLYCRDIVAHPTTMPGTSPMPDLIPSRQLVARGMGLDQDHPAQRPALERYRPPTARTNPRTDTAQTKTESAQTNRRRAAHERSRLRQVRTRRDARHLDRSRPAARANPSGPSRPQHFLHERFRANGTNEPRQPLARSSRSRRRSTQPWTGTVRPA